MMIAMMITKKKKLRQDNIISKLKTTRVKSFIYIKKKNV